MVDLYTHGQKLDEPAANNGYRTTEVHIQCCTGGVKKSAITSALHIPDPTVLTAEDSCLLKLSK